MLIELERRISLSWREFWELKFVFKSILSEVIKQQADSCIIPCLIFGAPMCSTIKRDAEGYSMTYVKKPVGD